MASSVVAPKPFPWASLPRRSRAEGEANRQARELISPFLALERLAAEASALLRQPVELHVRSITAEALRPGRRVSLEFQGTEVRCWVEAEAPLQIRAVETVLGFAPGLSNPAQPASPEVEGAWAAILVALVRRCAQGAAPRLGPPPIPGEVAVVSAVVRLGGELFSLRVGVPLALVPPVAPPFDREALERLGSLRISMPLVAAVGQPSLDEVAAMVLGAAWIPGEAWSLVRQDGRWSGRAWLAAGGAELGAAVEVRHERDTVALVLRRPCEPLSWEPTMPTPVPEAEAPPSDLADALAEAPVVVRVEVASITLEAQQWARLGVGDVVAAGVRLGEPVTLRAGGSVFARGELCVMDGELAVKITQRFLTLSPQPPPHLRGRGGGAGGGFTRRTRRFPLLLPPPPHEDGEGAGGERLSGQSLIQGSASFIEV